MVMFISSMRVIGHCEDCIKCARETKDRHDVLIVALASDIYSESQSSDSRVCDYVHDTRQRYLR